MLRTCFGDQTLGASQSPPWGFQLSSGAARWRRLSTGRHRRNRAEARTVQVTKPPDLAADLRSKPRRQEGVHMDGARFDKLTRALFAGPLTRRKVLRRLTGGSLAIGLGAHTVSDATARQVGTEAFDLECRQPGIRFLCTGEGPATRCGDNCLCAARRETGEEHVCIVPPADNCPRRRQSCLRDRECARGEVCIRVGSCCPNHPERGKCVRKCPA
jgi:hypothetical protein